MLDVMLESYKINKACFHNVVLLYVRSSGGCEPLWLLSECGALRLRLTAAPHNVSWENFLTKHNEMNRQKSCTC